MELIESDHSGRFALAYYENYLNDSRDTDKDDETKEIDDYDDYPVLAKFAQNVIIVRESVLSSSV